MDSEIENGRYRVQNFAMDAADPKYMLEKLNIVFDILKHAAKLIIAIEFVFKNVEDGSSRFQYAHENKTLLERYKLVATTEDLTIDKILLRYTDVIDSGTKERANRNWKFYKLANVTIFAALLKEDPIGCNDTVLPDPLLKNDSVK